MTKYVEEEQCELVYKRQCEDVTGQQCKDLVESVPVQISKPVSARISTHTMMEDLILLTFSKVCETVSEEVCRPQTKVVPKKATKQQCNTEYVWKCSKSEH